MPKPTKMPRAKRMSARERDWQAVENAPTDYAESVLKAAFYKKYRSPSLKSARQRAKWENLSEGEKLDTLAKSAFETYIKMNNLKTKWSDLCQHRRECFWYPYAKAALAVMEGRTL